MGLGISGQAAALFLIRRGAQVAGVDKNAIALQATAPIKHLQSLGLAIYSESEPIDVAMFDFVVVSPGIPQTHFIYVEAKRLAKEIIGEIELACRSLQGTSLGITGSNGKTTTTMLTTHVLNAAGKPAAALGNIGIPLTTALDDPLLKGKILVLELSSWQLDTLQSKPLDAAIILNITPNHLDRYDNLEEYALAKLHLFDCIKEGCPYFMGDRAWQTFHHVCQKKKPILFGYSNGSDLFCDKEKIFFNKAIEYVLPKQYIGLTSHDVENMMAAYLLCRSQGVDKETFLQAFSTFQKPPHRIEFVRRIQDVAYYNDSKGTNIDAVARAVESLPGQIVLIAGGVHKGTSYRPWIDVFKGKVRHVCAIGQAADLIRQDLTPFIPVDILGSLKEAIDHASNLSHCGDSILLSPGCSSYDMFRNYEHRGEEFKRIVQSL